MTQGNPSWLKLKQVYPNFFPNSSDEHILHNFSHFAQLCTFCINLHNFAHLCKFCTSLQILHNFAQLCTFCTVCLVCTFLICFVCWYIQCHHCHHNNDDDDDDNQMTTVDLLPNVRKGLGIDLHFWSDHDVDDDGYDDDYDNDDNGEKWDDSSSWPFAKREKRIWFSLPATGNLVTTALDWISKASKFKKKFFKVSTNKLQKILPLDWIQNLKKVFKVSTKSCKRFYHWIGFQKFQNLKSFNKKLQKVSPLDLIQNLKKSFLKFRQTSCKRFHHWIWFKI